ncbi:MAG: hypothetical protein VKJ04_01350 [Vampirovibrionales bacterium]|nr:hypothetical protein [Vampirovibrionales bacterium]
MGGFYGYGYPGAYPPAAYGGWLPGASFGVPGTFISHHPQVSAHHDDHGFTPTWLKKLLWPVTLIGGAAATVAVSLRFHKSKQVRDALGGIKTGVEDAMLDIRDGKAVANSAKLKTEYEKAQKIITANHGLIRPFPLKSWSGAMDDITLNAIALHSQAIQAIQRELKREPANAVALRKLLDKLHESMKDELALGIIGRRVPMIDSRLRAINEGVVSDVAKSSEEYNRLVAQRSELTKLLGDIMPAGSSSASKYQDYNLASRYINSTLDILHGSQFLAQPGGQTQLRKALRDLYATRLTGVSAHMPADNAFWEGLSGWYGDSAMLVQRAGHAQNIRWRIENIEMSPAERKALEREYRQMINGLSSELEGYHLPVIYENRGMNGPEYLNMTVATQQLGHPRL